VEAVGAAFGLEPGGRGGQFGRGAALGHEADAAGIDPPGGEPEVVEPFIKSIGLYRNKAKNIVAAARRVVDDFGGVVPSGRADLETLPGVGSKSAAVIIANCFGVPAIAVDTHVGRVSRRLGLTKQTDPDKVETALTALWPRERLLQAHHTLIFQGRRICDARKPRCSECPVERDCKKVDVDASA
jgi:endonuclease-3